MSDENFSGSVGVDGHLRLGPEHGGIRLENSGGTALLINSAQVAMQASLSSVATLDELVMSMYSGATFANGSAATFWVFTAPFPLKIVACSFVSIFTSIAASDTSYWSIQLTKTTDNSTSAAIATKTTQLTNGALMNQRADWNFDAIPFDPVAQVFAKGDTCSFLMTPTSAPTALNGILATVRYVPS